MTDRQRFVLREMQHFNTLVNGGLRDAARTCRVLVKLGYAEERTPGHFWCTPAGTAALDA